MSLEGTVRWREPSILASTMKLKIKSLCGLKRSAIKEHFEEIQLLVARPRFVCGKCARVAGCGSHLCKARKLSA